MVFRRAWPKVKGRTGVEEAELGTEGNPSAAEGKLPIEALRLRSDSLLYIAYDQCRRALSYLRWHEDDANDFAPSLTGPRGPRAKKDDEAKKDETKKDDEAKKDEAKKDEPVE